MAVYLIGVALLGIIPYIVGRAITHFLCHKEPGAAVSFVSGSAFMLFIFLLMQMVALKTNLSLRVLSVLFAAVSVVLAAVSVLLCRVTLFSGITESFQTAKKHKISSCFILVFGVLCVSLILFVPAYYGNDLTVETAAVTGYTGTLYEYNPLTGGRIVYGMSFLAKLNVIPIVYAALCELGSADVAQVIPVFGALWGLVLNLSCVGVLFRAMGLEGAKEQRAYAFYLLLLIVGTYHRNTYAYRLLHQGFAAGTIYLSCFGMLLMAALCLIGNRMIKRIGGAKA